MSNDDGSDAGPGVSGGRPCRGARGAAPEREQVKALYLAKCASALGAEIVAGELTAAEEAMLAEWDERLGSEEWLHARGGLNGEGVKIHEDVRVVEGNYKAPGGLIRVTATVRQERIDDLSMSGDFTVLPASAVGAIEEGVRGLPPVLEILQARIVDIYEALEVVAPGMMPTDVAKAILHCVRRNPPR